MKAVIIGSDAGGATAVTRVRRLDEKLKSSYYLREAALSLMQTVELLTILAAQ